MTPMKPIIVGALLWAGTALTVQAQYYYGYPGAGAPPSLQHPPSWSYDPYTSGMAPCPQGLPDESRPCSQRMPPTYGQPSYWSR